MSDQASIVVRALKATQADGVAVFSFFLPGSDVVRVADISRIVRPNGELKGFQRPAIREHVRDIADFLSSGPVLFPNAIILALSPEVEFRHARGSRPAGMLDVADSGTLTLPVRPEGERAAWIVDGQQRAMALARASKTDIAVPVVGFVSSDLSTHREQFILVNQAKPLDVRLIDELLPEVAALLPKRLATRKLPSELVKALARDRDSPFRGLVRKADGEAGSVSVSDTALVESIRQSLRAPMGALNRFLDEAGDGRGTDTDAMYNVLIQYWSAVRCAFPDAWGLPPNESRLMHSAGLRAMSALMDQIMIRADTAADPKHEIAASLARLAPHCAWTAGAWGGDLKLAWNDVQATNQHVARLARHLCRLDRDLARPNR